MAASDEIKEFKKSFSLAVKLFKRGDLERAREEFENLLRKTPEEKKKSFLISFFTEPSLRVKSEGYIKKIIQLQFKAEEKRKKKEGKKQERVETKERVKTKEDRAEIKEKTPKPGISTRIAKRAKAMNRHPLMVGVDISDHSIEIFQLDAERNILACARSVLEKGIVESAEIKDAERLGERFQETLKKAGLDVLMAKKGVRIKGFFSLPESKAFIREFVFETRDNLQGQLKDKIKENVPIPLEDLCWDYVELGDQLKKTRLLMVAVPNGVVEEYVSFFEDNGVDPVVFDIEAASVARALTSLEEDKGNTAIVDIGARTSIINIFDSKKDLNLSVSVFCAGNYFTQRIAEKMGITEEEAAKIKEESGFEKEPVLLILKEYSFGLIKEIKDALKYHQARSGLKTDKIILTGGSALLPGIEEFFQQNFEEKVEIGRPLRNINPGSFFPDEKEATLFANVIGLAMRALEQNFIDTGINLLTDEIKRKEKILQRERERFFMYVVLYLLVVIVAISVAVFIFYRLGIIKLLI